MFWICFWMFLCVVLIATGKYQEICKNWGDWSDVMKTYASVQRLYILWLSRGHDSSFCMPDQRHRYENITMKISYGRKKDFLMYFCLVFQVQLLSAAEEWPDRQQSDVSSWQSHTSGSLHFTRFHYLFPYKWLEQSCDLSHAWHC